MKEKKLNIVKVSVIAAIVCVVSVSFCSQIANAAQVTYTSVREIVGLKCPGHDHLKDNHNFMYQDVNGNPATTYTRCIRCNYTKGVHKAQK